MTVALHAPHLLSGLISIPQFSTPANIETQAHLGGSDPRTRVSMTTPAIPSIYVYSRCEGSHFGDVFDLMDEDESHSNSLETKARRVCGAANWQQRIAGSKNVTGALAGQEARGGISCQAKRRR
jgi:hypothetical protein